MMNAALSVHHGEVRRALERHGGHEAGTEVRGDEAGVRWEEREAGRGPERVGA